MHHPSENKSDVIFVLNLVSRHKAGGGTIPRILDLDTRWKSVVKFRTLLHCDRESDPGIHWLDPRAGLDPFEKINSFRFRESNPDSPIVKSVAWSLCRLKYSSFSRLKRKLCLKSNIPFYFRSSFQVNLFKGATKILQASAFIASLSAKVFYDEQILAPHRTAKLEDHSLSGVCDFI